MTAPTLPGLTPGTPDPEPRPGSRAARLALPVSLHVLQDMCTEHGVCLRPVALRRTDLHTGQTELIDIPCGSTREDKCAPAPSAPAGCGRSRSARVGTAPTNPSPRPNPPRRNSAA